MVADPDRVVEHWPGACQGCGGSLGKGDAVGDPVAHQVSEIITRIEVTKHLRMRVRCECGARTLAELPAGVPAGALGPGVAAAAATMCAARVRRRETVRIFSDLFGLTVSPASLQRLLEQSALALAEPYQEVLTALDTEPVRGADETSWPQAGKKPVAVGLHQREDGALLDRHASRPRRREGAAGRDTRGSDRDRPLRRLPVPR